MTAGEFQPSLGVRTIAAGAAVVGPLVAWWREHPGCFVDVAGSDLAAFLLGLGVVPMVALLGVIVGVLAIRQGGLAVGLASIVANLPALLVCGFLFLFFALGGSR